MNISPNCATCAHMREHEQLGGQGAFCHAEAPSLHLLSGGSRLVRGRPELQGLQMVGLWAPVDKHTGWCAHHEPAEVLQ